MTRQDKTRQDYTIEDYAMASVEERRNLFINLGTMLANEDSQWLREACEMFLAIIPVTNPTGCDVTRQDTTRRDQTGQDTIRPDEIRQDKT